MIVRNTGTFPPEMDASVEAGGVALVLDFLRLATPFWHVPPY